MLVSNDLSAHCQFENTSITYILYETTGILLVSLSHGETRCSATLTVVGEKKHEQEDY